MTHLRRSLGLTRATAMVVGTIIGASIFVQPSEITALVPSLTAVALVWAIAGILTLFGSLVCAELASAYPTAGGVYEFLKRAFSPAMGFLWGWAMYWSMHSGIIAAIAVVFARYLAFFVPLSDLGIRVAAIAVILVLSAVNYVGVKHGSALQTAVTIGKVVVILAMIGVGAALGPRAPIDRAATLVSANIGPASVALALIAALFAFGGWHMVTYTSEETHDPERTIPRALVIGVLVVTVCYVLLNGIYFYVLPLATVVSSTRIAADAADAVVGRGGAAFMSAVVIFSTFGALSGIVLTGPRVYFAMARDGMLFRWMGVTHERFRTPHRAVLLQAVWACVLVATGTYRTLFTRVIYTEWIFFALMAVGLMVLRRRSDYAPRYRVWGYPLVPIVFVASSLVIVLNQVVSDPVESATGLLLVAVGLPVYYFWVRKRAIEAGATRADH